MSNPKSKQVAGRFEQEHGILHLWFPNSVLLRDADAVTAFFDEVVEDWIDATPGRFYLLVDYSNLHIAAHVADSYSANIKRFQPKLLGTFRYGIPGDFTGVAVSLGNMKLQTPSNLFNDESAARTAIAQLKALGPKKGSTNSDVTARRSATVDYTTLPSARK